jgi:hypothetical protein
MVGGGTLENASSPSRLMIAESKRRVDVKPTSIVLVRTCLVGSTRGRGSRTEFLRIPLQDGRGFSGWSVVGWIDGWFVIDGRNSCEFRYRTDARTRTLWLKRGLVGSTGGSWFTDGILANSATKSSPYFRDLPCRSVAKSSPRFPRHQARRRPDGGELAFRSRRATTLVGRSASLESCH